MSTQLRRSRVVACAGALAFLFAATWNALVSFQVVVPSPPDGGDGGEADVRAYWVWFAGTVPAIEVAQFALLVGLAALVYTVAHPAAVDRAPDRRQPVAVGCIVIGSALWMAALGVRLGSNRAVALLATHDNPIQPTNSIAFASDWAVTGVELVGALIAGVGLASSGRVRIPGLGVAAGLCLALLGLAQFTELSEAATVLRLLTGAVLLPAWLVVAGGPAPVRTPAAVHSEPVG